jgi:hypothetical protein
MLSTHAPDLGVVVTSFDKQSQYRFMDIIGGYVKKLKFAEQDTRMTYVFEFIHEASRVLTRYTPEQYGLHLIGARNIDTHRELTEDQLDKAAQKIGSMRPRRWKANTDEAEIRKLMDEIGQNTKDFEGAVFRDAEGRRIKMKRADYVKLHHLLDKLSYKHLIPAILEGEEDEIVAYFPAAQELVDNFKNKFRNFIDHVMNRIRYWKEKGMPKKELAATLRGRPAKRWDAKSSGPLEKISPEEPNAWVASKILSYIDFDEEMARQKIEAELRELGTGKKADGSSVNFNPSRLMELLGIEDTESDDTSEI